MTFENSDFARKFRRILRQAELCRSSYVLGDQVGIFSQDRKDAEKVEQLFSQFFIECYHLKDWIREDKMISDQIKKSVELFIEKSSSLSLAGDVTNSEKHLILRRKSRISNTVKLHTIANTLGPVGTYPIGGIYNFTISVETGNRLEPIDALGLVSQCVADWQRFIAENNLDY